MASSSLTITCDRGIIRKYGGTRSNVKSKKAWYEDMDVDEFLAWHPYLDERDFKSMKLYTRFNKS
ncbi:hypothetical protein [Bacillus cereus]|uniref:hypothetical protein n=1 Tax=Bacillus cereus TaxID=1396 RepID=UPI001D0F41A8|nr:hypothetical protein [Bacillus cereus]MCC2383495.1 hypothetical protein [Bacillus cereus]